MPCFTSYYMNRCTRARRFSTFNSRLQGPKPSRWSFMRYVTLISSTILPTRWPSMFSLLDLTKLRKDYTISSSSSPTLCLLIPELTTILNIRSSRKYDTCGQHLDGLGKCYRPTLESRLCKHGIETPLLSKSGNAAWQAARHHPQECGKAVRIQRLSSYSRPSPGWSCSDSGNSIRWHGTRWRGPSLGGVSPVLGIS